jgi:hypothetical protein
VLTLAWGRFFPHSPQQFTKESTQNYEIMLTADFNAEVRPEKKKIKKSPKEEAVGTSKDLS